MVFGNGRESALHGGFQHDLERRPVAPVIVAFGIAASFIGLVGQLIGFEGLLQHRPAIVRILLPYGQGAVHHPGVAHGVPVDLAAVEPSVGLVPGRLEAFVHDCPRHGRPLVRRHLVVQPVIADGDGHRHLPDIQEMGRIPVGERAHGQHLVDGPPRVGFPAVDPVGIAQPEDALQRLPGCVQQASADECPRHGRLVQHRVTECADHAVGLRELAVHRHLRFFASPHQQPRVRGRLGYLRKGRHAGEQSCGQDRQLDKP